RRSMESSSRSRRIFKALLRGFVILCVVELALDGALFVRRVFTGFATREESKKTIIWYEDDYLRGRIVPHQTNVRIGPAQASINSLGFRGPELGGAPYRVVCLGDSVTFGWGISNDDATYPAALGKILGSGRADVLNAGMPRWNSCDLLDL